MFNFADDALNASIVLNTANSVVHYDFETSIIQENSHFILNFDYNNN